MVARRLCENSEEGEMDKKGVRIVLSFNAVKIFFSLFEISGSSINSFDIHHK